MEKYAAQNYYAYFHLGMMYYVEEDLKKARKAFEKSVALRKNPWALYALAELSLEEKKADSALLYMREVLKMRPRDIRALRGLWECAHAAGEEKDYIEAYEKLPESLQNESRLKVLAAMAYIACGDVERFERILEASFEFNDIQEGEKSFAQAWEKYLTIKYFKKDMSEEEKNTITLHPVPRMLDYNTHI